MRDTATSAYLGQLRARVPPAHPLLHPLSTSTPLEHICTPLRRASGRSRPCSPSPSPEMPSRSSSPAEGRSCISRTSGCGHRSTLTPPLPHSLAPPGASSCASSGRLWAARRHSQGGEGATALAARASCFRSRRFHRLWTAAFWSTQASVQIHSLSELLSSIDVELRRALVKRPPPQEPPPQHVPLWEAQPVPPGSVPRSPRTPH